MTAIITCGIPASGKSTWAREVAKENDNVMIVSRDDIRLAYGLRSGENEQLVTRVHRAQMEAGFLNGYDVIVADTNINPKFRRQLIKFCHEHNVDVEIAVFPISLDEAIMRDSKRVKPVGPSVITKFYNDFKSSNPQSELLPAPKATPYEHGTNGLWKPDAIVVDIDGTVARHTKRSPYDYTRVSEDEPIEDVIRIVRTLEVDYDIVFVSGREDSCRHDTALWIDKHIGLDSFDLYMRKSKDMRPDYVIKTELYDEHVIPKFNIRMVLDDRDQVVRHLRARGITVAQVAPGRF